MRLQDNPRFLAVQPDVQLYKNALTWVLLSEGDGTPRRQLRRWHAPPRSSLCASEAATASTGPARTRAPNPPQCTPTPPGTLPSQTPLTLGIPIVYYGSEQGLSGGKVSGPNFEGGYRQPLWPSGFDEAHPLYLHIQLLAR
jgi:hypothetical protein